MQPWRPLREIYGDHVWFTVGGVQNPIVFVGAGTSSLIRYIIRNGDSYTFGYDVAGLPPHGTGFQYYVFDNMKSFGTFGLELYNSAGAVTFNSNRPSLQVVHASVPAGMLAGGANVGVAIPVFREYGVLPSGKWAINAGYGRFGYQYIGGVGGGYVVAEQFGVTDTGFRWDWYAIPDSLGDPAPDTRLFVDTYGYPYITLIDASRLPDWFG